MSRLGGVGGVTRGVSLCLFVGCHLTDTLLNITYQKKYKVILFITDAHYVSQLPNTVLGFCYHSTFCQFLYIFVVTAVYFNSFFGFQAECPDLQGETWCFQERAKETSP